MKIALLCGGSSSERDISFKSAAGVMAHMDNVHEVTAVDTGRSEIFTDFTLQKDKPIAENSMDNLISLLGLLKDMDPEFALIMLHGGSGEDGHIQGILDICGIPYSGSSMGASFMGMDKIISKIIMEYHNIPTPGWTSYKRHDKGLPNTGDMSYPLIVKPACEGSTVGLSKINSADELPAALEKALATDDAVLIEEFIPGRELTVPVLNSVSYPMVEIIPVNELYDYECKYGKGKSRYICPADIEPDIAETAASEAVKLYEAMGMKGIVRFDFRLHGERHYFLEANTLPGMTELSLVPMSFKSAGIDYTELIERIISG